MIDFIDMDISRVPLTRILKSEYITFDEGNPPDAGRISFPMVGHLGPLDVTLHSSNERTLRGSLLDFYNWYRDRQLPRLTPNARMLAFEQLEEVFGQEIKRSLIGEMDRTLKIRDELR